MPKQAFLVDGLHCQGCANTVASALRRLESVSAVDVVLVVDGSSAVHVQSSSELSVEQVQSALDEDDNFSVRSA